MLERTVVSLRETSRPRQPALDRRLQGRARRRLVERFLEQRDGAVEALELGEEEEHVGPHRAEPAVLEQLAGNRPRARPLPAGAMGASRGQRPPVALADLVRRRQPQRRLGQLGRARRGAATAGDRRRILQRGGDGWVGLVRREREMAGAQHWIRDEPGDAFVHDPAPRPEIVVEHRRQQRVGEPDRAAVTLHHLCRERGRERTRRRADPLHKRLPRRPQRRRRTRARRASPPGGRRVGCGRGPPASPDRQRPERVDILVEHASELQREERVAARLLMDPQQRLARERPAEAVLEDPVQSTDAERSDPEPFDVHRLLKLGRRPAGGRGPAGPRRRGAAARRRARSPTKRRATGRRRSRRRPACVGSTGSAHRVRPPRARDGPRPRPRASSRRSATSSARLRGGDSSPITPSRTRSKRSPSPT